MLTRPSRGGAVPGYERRGRRRIPHGLGSKTAFQRVKLTMPGTSSVCGPGAWTNLGRATVRHWHCQVTLRLWYFRAAWWSAPPVQLIWTLGNPLPPFQLVLGQLDNAGLRAKRGWSERAAHPPQTPLAAHPAGLRPPPRPWSAPAPCCAVTPLPPATTHTTALPANTRNYWLHPQPPTRLTHPRQSLTVRSAWRRPPP